jgi:DNA polymerase-3 subunit epsilon
VTLDKGEKLPKTAVLRKRCPNLRNQMIYAITDIETTGSHASGNSIVEIGVLLWDGERVLEEFSTFINPGVPLPRFITALTGITDEMVEDAPTFAQVSDRLEELFEGAIFVAHNVSFDHSFIRAEFAAIGINWNPPRLCTMRLARKAFPGQTSYGLNAICNWMGLINAQAHRALSDARVAFEILERALPLVEVADLKKMVARHSGVVFLPPNLPEESFMRLPESPGVYYLYNEKGKPLYIGKANNIKKRIKQHFTTHAESARAQAFMREVRDIGFELSGNELIALLLEDAEIRKHWPPFNSAQKRKTRRTHIVRYSDQNGFERLAVNTSTKGVASLRSFASLAAANRWLYALSSEFEIDARMLGLSMFDLQAVQEEPPIHNERLDKAIRVMLARDPSFVIECAGRQSGERAYVLVERGILKGYAFIQDDSFRMDTLLFHLKSLPHTENSSAILDAFSEGKWGYKRIETTNQIEPG